MQKRQNLIANSLLTRHNAMMPQICYAAKHSLKIGRFGTCLMAGIKVPFCIF